MPGSKELQGGRSNSQTWSRASDHRDGNARAAYGGSDLFLIRPDNRGFATAEIPGLRPCTGANMA
jgi:hypothetical protein